MDRKLVGEVTLEIEHGPVHTCSFLAKSLSLSHTYA
jgi:hypothetical protein